MTPSRQRLAVLLSIVLAAVLAAGAVLFTTGGDPEPQAATPTASPSPSGPTVVTAQLNLDISGAFGTQPKIHVPDVPAPEKLTVEILQQGEGPAVEVGHSAAVHYYGRLWTLEKGMPAAFDDSFERGVPVAFPIGTGKVIKGWDAALLGAKAGTRMLVSVPPEFGYGAEPSESNKLAGQTLLFVIDVLDVYPVGIAASGTEVTSLPKGIPDIDSRSGAKPTITSVEGAEPKGKEPRSTVLIKGSGEKIDPSKSLVFHFVEKLTSDGSVSADSWAAGGVRIAPAAQIMAAGKALIGQNIGTRIAMVTPDKGDKGQGSVVVMDIVDQI